MYSYNFSYISWKTIYTNEGSIIISSEIGNPMKPWTVWGGAQPFTVYNTELDSSIAVLHYQLIIDENTNTVNDWSDIESNKKKP